MRISEADLLAALPRLRRYARSLTRNPAEAGDLLRDCLEKALAGQHAWGGEDLTGWLITVMTGLYRNRGRRGRGDLGDEPEADPLERQRLAGAVDRLSADNRAVLMLVVVEGYGYAEAAAALGVPIGTVMSRLSRSRSALAEAQRSHNVIAFRRPS